MISEQIEQVAGWIAGACRPAPRPKTLIEFARTVKVCEGPAAREEGGELYVPEAHPPQYFVLDEIGRALRGESPYRSAVVLKPTQDGGTLCTVAIPALYVTGELGDPWVAGFPDMRLAGVCWRNKMRKPLEASGLEHWLPSSGPGSDGASQPVEISLNNTPLYFIGGGASNEAGQASLTGRVLSRDERSSMEAYIAELMEGRTDAYDARAYAIDTSTIKFDDGDPTLAAWELSTRGVVHYPCTRCWTWRRWLWRKHVRADFTTAKRAASSIRLVCPSCGHQMDDEERVGAQLLLEHARLVMGDQKVDDTGTVVGDAPESDGWGLRWSFLDSPRLTMARQAARYVRAKQAMDEGEPAPMRRFTRDRLTETFRDDRKPLKLTQAWLLKLSAAGSYDIGEVPDWVEVLSCGVDVQLRWFYWWVWGLDRDLRRCLVAAGTETIATLDGEPVPRDREPTVRERWQTMDLIEEKMNGGFARQDRRDLVVPVALRGIDVGFRQDELRGWLAHHPHWNAVKGDKDDDADERGPIDDKLAPGGRARWHQARLARDRYGEFELWRVIGDAVKPSLHAGFLKPTGPGSSELPRGLLGNSPVIRHLVAEQPDERGRWKKVTTNAANHYLDCAVYGLAIGRAWIDAQLADTSDDYQVEQQRARQAAQDRPANRPLAVARRHSRIARRRQR